MIIIDIYFFVMSHVIHAIKCNSILVCNLSCCIKIQLLGQLWNDATTAAATRAAGVRVPTNTRGGAGSSTDDDESIDKLLRESITRALIHVVHVVGDVQGDSSSVVGTAVSLVRFALHEAAHGDDLLLDSALELWDETLRACGAPPPPLLAAFDDLVALLARTIESLAPATRVLLAYWRAPPTSAGSDDDVFAIGAATSTSSALTALFGAVRDDAVTQFLLQV